MVSMQKGRVEGTDPEVLRLCWLKRVSAGG